MSDNDPYGSPQYGQNDPYSQQPGQQPPYGQYGEQKPADNGQTDPYGNQYESQYGSQTAPQYGNQYGNQYSQQQPQYGYQQQYGFAQQPAGPPPNNHLVWAILSTVLCCLPLGIVSIVFATQVNSKWALGDVQGAQESSRKAKTWAIASAVVGGIVIALYAVFIIVAIANGNSSSSSTY